MRPVTASDPSSSERLGCTRTSGCGRSTGIRAGCRWWCEETESQPVENGQLGEEDEQQCREVEPEQQWVVLGVMCRDQEEPNRHRCEPLLGGRVLCAFVDLFPQSELVKHTGIVLEGSACDVVEH